MKILIDVISAFLNKFDWTDLERPFQKQLPRCKSDVENGAYLRHWRKWLPWQLVRFATVRKRLRCEYDGAKYGKGGASKEAAEC